MTAALSDTWYVSRTDISPDPHNPRTSFDAAKLRELAESIITYGLIQPIVIRPTTKEDTASGVETPYVIVAGERRWQACDLAHIQELPCVLLPEVTVGEKRTTASTAERSSLPVDLVSELALVENIQRADLTPVEEARAFKRILDNDSSVNQTLLAKRLGLSLDYVRKRLALLALPDEVLDHVHAERIGLSAAMCLHALVGKVSPTAISQLAHVAATKRWPLAKIEKAVGVQLGQAPRARYAGNDAAPPAAPVPEQGQAAPAPAAVPVVPAAPTKAASGDWAQVVLPELGTKRAKIATAVTSDGVPCLVVAYRGDAQALGLLKESIRATILSFTRQEAADDNV